MQAVVFPAAETIALERVPDPICAPDEVIVRVARCGICGTDVHIYRNEYMSDFPLIPGHEFGGVIVEVGKEVTGFKTGRTGGGGPEPLLRALRHVPQRDGQPLLELAGRRHHPRRRLCRVRGRAGACVLQTARRARRHAGRLRGAAGLRRPRHEAHPHPPGRSGADPGRGADGAAAGAGAAAHGRVPHRRGGKAGAAAGNWRGRWARRWLWRPAPTRTSSSRPLPRAATAW
jgi:hypothetical protein